MTTYFASDMHLDDKKPELFQAFFAFLDEIRADASRIYLLGDLFEYWIGDDYQTPLIVEFKRRLRTLSDQGIDIFIMHGNRDFLIGTAFTHEIAGQLLPDPYTLRLGHKNVVLSHGDILCTDDKGYQKLRKILRNPVFKWSVSHLTLKARKKLASKLRSESAQATSMKQSDIMDVNQNSVCNLILENQADILLHGHTHRPQEHNVQINEVQKIRMVLGSWSPSGGVYAHDRNGELTLETFRMDGN